MSAINTEYDIAIIGSGMGALTAAALLSMQGAKIIIFEKNYLPGGCTSSYQRKGYVFESGATTLVGLDEGMPLHYLCKITGLGFDTIKLEVPMAVHLPDGKTIFRHQDINKWISTAAEAFGQQNQQERFWNYCYKISQSVWDASTRFRSFPFSNIKDATKAIWKSKLTDARQLPLAFSSMHDVLKKFDLDRNELFVQFVNEQLLITAQNNVKEVNALFGSAALCYTNFGNYYVKGGMINLVNPIISFIESNGSQLLLRTAVDEVKKTRGGYQIILQDGAVYQVDNVVSGIPVNNLNDLTEINVVEEKKLLPSKSLYSAFQMGLGIRSNAHQQCIHHQVILDNPIPQIQSNSFFVSFSHPNDELRSESGKSVISVSSHIRDPENANFDKEYVADFIIDEMKKRGLLHKEDIDYRHVSGPGSWQKWTGRKYGFVGGYPQYLQTKPWQMINARTRHKGLYLAGDTTYPGQGIPGVTLSGIIAAEKLVSDGRLKT